MAKKQNGRNCGCMCHSGQGAIMMGIGILIVVALRYMSYSWREIAAIVGILLVLKGIFKYMKK